MSAPSAAAEYEGSWLIGTLTRRRYGRSPRLGAAVRELATTTPGRLALVAVSLVLVAACFGAIAATAVHSRAQAATAVRTQTEPLLGQAATLYTSLSGANATTTATFLNGGLEPPARRAEYLSDLNRASAALAALGREVGGSPQAAAAVTTVTEQLPVYTGLVESARANNRQGFPVGAAYLRRASALLDGMILPAADHLYAIEARRLSSGYGAGTSHGPLVVIAVVALLAVAALVVAQRFLTRVSRRILNVPLVIATVLLAAVSVWAVVGLLAEEGSLTSARRGSDAVEVMSATSVLLSRAQSDLSLTLVNRGSDETDPLDFNVVMRALGGPGGLISEARSLTRQGGSPLAAARLGDEFTAYRSQTGRVVKLQNSGLTAAAIKSASSPAATAGFDRLNASLAAQIVAAQRRFDNDAASATGALSGLAFAIPIVALLVAALAVVGIRPRLQEYR
jgi:hypothetical protein